MSEFGIVKKCLIVGLGMTGLSAARYCQRVGRAFDLCDTRKQLPDLDAIHAEFPDADIATGDLDAEILKQYAELIVSPGVAVSHPAIQAAAAAGVKISGDIQLFAEQCKKPIIAITGSNGKSTVTTLVGDLLRAAGKRVAVGGNIGVPALDLNDADIYVLELSSFQLETTTDLSALAAVILNLSEDHMDRYAGMTDYLLAKQRIFQRCQHIVVNRDDTATLPADGQADVSFGLSEPADGEFGLRIDNGQRWICFGSEKLIAASELKIKGLHNLTNVMAALALVRLAGVALSDVIPALSSFAGLDHRCQWLGEYSGVSFYNDSKATNVASTLAAIHGLAADVQGKLYLLLGGEGKGQDFSPLLTACKEPVGGVFTFGNDGELIAQILDSHCPVFRHVTMDEAFNAIVEKSQHGDVVLLSPACASFDQFKNYAARGQYFCSLVEGIK